MKKLTFLLGLVPFVLQAQSFEEVESVMKNYYYSANAVADFDGDGFLDILHIGAIDSNDDGDVDLTYNEIYKNNGESFSVFGDLGSYSTHLGDVKFIDFDNDGLLDFITTGLSYNDIVNYQQYRFKNTGSGFEMVENLPGKIYGGLEVFDFNHDGLQDYALNGTQYVEGIGFTYDLDFYLNTGAGYEAQQAWMPGGQNSSFKMIDLNNDQLLDMVVFGYDSDLEPYFRVFLNNEGTLESEQELDPLTDGKLAYADFNADGFLDFVASGVDGDYDEFLGLYLNDGTGNFEVMVIEGEGLGSSSVETGDLNNDGYYDFIVIGDDADYNGWTKIFLFNPADGSFTKAEETGLFEMGSQGDIKLFDYNNDHHLDVLMSGFDWADEDMPSVTKFFVNTSTEENQKPSAPTELNLEQDGSKYLFSWSGASDDKTPTEALQYEITVGTASGAQDIAKYVVTTPFWFLDLEDTPSNVYWSVKSIDASRVYSDASEENQLSNVEVNLTNSIQVFPNPASEFVYVKSNEIISSIEIYTLNGQKLDAQLSDDKLNISHLAKGVYVLKIQLENTTVTKKLAVK